jgi:hypothetical protein
LGEKVEGVGEENVKRKEQRTREGRVGKKRGRGCD